jgi:hypothetical protein
MGELLRWLFETINRVVIIVFWVWLVFHLIIYFSGGA